MRTKLVKKGEHYYSLILIDNRELLATTEDTDNALKLSKQNCDEIFGIVDVDKLAEEYCTHEPKNTKELRDVNLIKLGFRDGFNKAMELNKDKLFTIEDMMQAIITTQVSGIIHNNEDRLKLIQSLQHPKEIEVEIEMDICGDKVYEVPEIVLDENGCLILKKL